MKTTERFDRAVTKLYNAFHNGTLNALDCKACAVGNICDNSNGWTVNFRHLCNYEQGLYGKQSGPLINVFGELRFFNPNIRNSGYSSGDLYGVESAFLNEFIGGYASDKERQFKGLCAVIEHLCELDNIPNVMDFTKLFEYDKENQPIHQL